jgi:amino acid adenylation domain-containing protein
MQRSPVEDILPLSPLQEGLLFHALYDREARSLYVAQFVARLDGPLDADRLRAAATALVDRHPNLRVSFRFRSSGQPVQVVRRDAALDWTEVDLTTSTSASTPTPTPTSASAAEDAHPDAGAAPDAFAGLAAADWSRGIDIEAGPLLRFILAREGAERHRLIFTAHHSVLDGWSIALLFQELFTLYATGGAGDDMPPPAPFRDYLAWMAGQDRDAARRRWREELAGLSEPTRVAPLGAGGSPGRRETPQPPQPPQTPEMPEEVAIELSESLTAALTARARQCRVTLNTIVQAGWAIALGHLTGRDDVVFGCTVGGRSPDLPGSENMIGLLVNTVPVRAELGQDDSVRDLLERIHRHRSGLLEHDHIGLADIQQAIGVDGPLFDTTVALENFPMSDYELGIKVHGLTVAGITFRETSHYPLTIVVSPGERLKLRFCYRPDIFDGDDMAAWAYRLRRYLQIIAADADVPLRTIAPLDPAEQGGLLADWSGRAMELPELGIHRLFEKRAVQAPDAVALVFAGTRVRYAELNERANRLAHHLIGLGVRPGVWVGIRLERGPNLIAAVLAVLKAGGAYLLLDPSFPAERARDGLAQTGAAFLVTDIGRGDDLAPVGVRLVRVDAERAAIAREPADDPVGDVSPDAAACVMFTSGSQGRPKGVVSTHRAVVGSLLGQEFVKFTPDDAVLHCSPVSWDAFALEVFGPLLAGGTVVLQPGPIPEPAQIASLLAVHHVTIGYLSASLLNFMLDEYPGALAGLRQLLTGGEAASKPHLCRALAEYPRLRIVNVYSPLECMMVTVWHHVRPADLDRPSVPLGRVVAGKRMYVLDRNLHVVPAGVVGELYLAGVGVAHGYLNKPGLTARRFLPDPYGPPGERMYRTGDLVRWTADGLVEFVGRADDQFKLRGFRIEPGEIESVLTGQPNVAEARVLVREDRPGDRRLVAYVVPEDAADFAAGRLRSRLAAALPDFMMPAAFVAIDRFPFTPNGKLDRAALPAPDYAAETVTKGPRDPREEFLCELFADVLGVPSVGIHDNFFQIGGHSLLAMRLISRVRAALRVDLKIAALFRHATVAEFAELIADLEARRNSSEPVATR